MVEHDLLDTIERVRDGMLSVDGMGRITFANAAANAVLRPRGRDLVGTPLCEVLCPELAVELMRPALAGTSFTIESDDFVPGHRFELRVHRGNDDSTIVIRDISDNALRLHALFDDSLDGIVFSAPDGRVFEANAAACAMLGRTREELLVLGRAGMFDPSDTRLTHLLEERARTGRARGEVRLRRADGTTFPAAVSTSVFTNAAGEVRTHLTLRDLTAVEQATSSLELLADISAVVQRPLALRDTLDGIASALVPRLADVVILDIVHVLEGTRILRHVARHSHDRTAFEVLETHPPAKPTARGVANVLRTRRPELVTHVTDEWLRDCAQSEAHYRAAKALAPQSVVMVPMIARDKVVGSLSLTSLDPRHRYTESDLALVHGIAERAAHAIEHAALYEAALAARVRRDEVLGMVSHDLRGLLHAIDLNAMLIPSRGGPDVAKTIHTVVAHANRLVDDLVAVTELESGQFSVTTSPHPISALIDEVLELYGATARAKSIELTATGDCVHVEVDGHRVVQALANLVGNAIKFAAPGTRVSVRSRPCGDFCVIEVADEGPGITPEHLTHIFDRFWRGFDSTTHGLGLGLAIAKGTVEAHGGRIEVESTPGRGSCFSVWLPVHDRQVAVSRAR